MCEQLLQHILSTAHTHVRTDRQVGNIMPQTASRNDDGGIKVA